MTVDFGFAPTQLTVHLVSGADFIQSLSTIDGTPWPAGTTVTLRIGSSLTDSAHYVDWPATITGPTCAWNVDKAAVAALGGPGTKLRAQVRYTDGATTDLTWMQGQVAWHG